MANPLALMIVALLIAALMANPPAAKKMKIDVGMVNDAGSI